MDAFDSDVLIFAATGAHPFSARILAHIRDAAAADDLVGVGSVLLLPELLSNPIRRGATSERDALLQLLGRLELRPVDEATAQLAAQLGAAYKLRAADAIHLASAVRAGADRFITNNRRDFPKSIAEIDIVYPADLPEPE